MKTKAQEPNRSEKTRSARFFALDRFGAVPSYDGLAAAAFSERIQHAGS